MVDCPCCHERLSLRTVRRHLEDRERFNPAAKRGESDSEVEQAGEPSDLEDESDEDEAEEASRRALSVPAARSALHAGLTVAAAYVTIGTITLLMLAAHTRFNLTEVCMSFIGELVALAAPGLMSACNPSKVFAQFKSLWTPEVVNIHLCPGECVAFVGSLSAATHCPQCNETRTDQHGKPRHVRTPITHDYFTCALQVRPTFPLRESVEGFLAREAVRHHVVNQKHVPKASVIEQVPKCCCQRHTSLTLTSTHNTRPVRVFRSGLPIPNTSRMAT